MRLLQDNGYISQVAEKKSSLMLFVLKQSNVQNEKIDFDQAILDAYNSICNLRVSSTSKFSDPVWDFNDELKGKVARSIVGSKLKMEFDKYDYIPSYVIFELKCIIYTLLTIPTTIRPSSKKLKVNTIFDDYKNGLRYIEHVFKLISNEYGGEYIQSQTRSLSEISESDFISAAATYPYIFSHGIEKVLNDISTIYVRRTILSEPVSADFTNLKWVNIPYSPKESVKQVMPDFIFERLSLHSTRMVVEFLELIGIGVQDTYSIKFVVNKHLNIGLTNKSDLEIYKAIRLIAKGFPTHEIINRCNALPNSAFNEKGELYGQTYLRRLLRDNIGCDLEHLKKYINEVYYCCSYIVAQYTGMRPSELAEIIVQDEQCLDVDINGFTVIKSTVRKKELNELSLFDDLWIAIPIVVDAIKAASFISVLKNNPYLYSNMDTVPFEKEAHSMASGGSHQTKSLISELFSENELEGFSFNQYMTRHTLAYQLFKADVGLAVISHQLKHLVDGIERYTSVSKTSNVTLGYGGIGDMLMKGERGNQNSSLRKRAEREAIVSLMNPDGNYAGIQGKEHKKKLQRVFEGYSAEGYTKEDVYDAMLEQGIGIVNVGTGFCYGGEREDFDSNLPCIGTLRCNPVRCSNAIVTKAHAAKWREVYLTNKTNLSNPDYEDNHDQIREAMIEAEAVLQLLGENLTA